MTYTLKVEHNKHSDEYYIILPEKLLKELDWKAGDNIEFKIKKDGGIIASKV